MRNLIYICLAILLTSIGCSSVQKNHTVKDISGKYRWDGFFELARHIDLRKDSIFIMDWQAGLLFGQSKGTWRLEGRKVILNSEFQPRKDTTGYIINKLDFNQKSTSTLIQFFDLDSIGLPDVDCIIDDGSMEYHLVSDTLGKVTSDLSNIKKIHASFVGMKPLVYQNTIKSFNVYIFTMLPERDYYKYLTNTELIVKNNRLYDYSIKKNKTIKTDYYIKVKEE